MSLRSRLVCPLAIARRARAHQSAPPATHHPTKQPFAAPPPPWSLSSFSTMIVVCGLHGCSRVRWYVRLRMSGVTSRSSHEGTAALCTNLGVSAAVGLLRCVSISRGRRGRVSTAVGLYVDLLIRQGRRRLAGDFLLTSTASQSATRARPLLLTLIVARPPGRTGLACCGGGGPYPACMRRGMVGCR